ncbi:MAG: autotransporter-associated beta strand repeat-containing protein [Pirellulales bacterium]|nr:autotransporter-associated beta strand repeat-containing protein [Pirellulales bacterium]
MNRFFRCFLLLAAASLIAVTPLQAAISYWVNPGAAGDINTGANWTGSVLPNAGDTMWVGAVSPELSTATANVTADFTNNLTPPEYLYVGRGAGTNGTVNHTAGELILNTGLSGLGRDGGTGAYNMSGGTLKMNGVADTPLLIGYGAGSSGAMTMSGTAAATITNAIGANNATFIGNDGGTGALTLNDGASISNTGNFFVGREGASSAGTITLNSTSTLSVINGWTVVGGGYGVEQGGTGTLNVKDSATLNTVTYTIIGFRGGTGTLNLSGGTVNDSGAFQVANAEFKSATTGTVNMTNGAVLNVGNMDTGLRKNATAVINMSDTSVINSTGAVFLGHYGGTGGSSTLNMSGSATLNTAFLQMSNSEAQYANSQASLVMSGTSTVNCTGYVIAGVYGSSTASITLNNSAVFNQTGGSQFQLGYGSGTGTITVNDSASFTTFNGTELGIRYFGYATGSMGGSATLNLNGGVYATPWINSNGGRGSKTVNLNGGTLQAQGDSNNFIGDTGSVGSILNVWVKGGANINTSDISAAPHGITISVPLKHDPAGPATDGGLTVTGGGVLTLMAANTLNGPTTVSGGTLALSRDASVASKSVTAAGGTTLSLGGASNLGTLDNLDLASGSTLDLALTPSAASPNAINLSATATMPNSGGINYAINAQGLTLDTVNPYTVISGTAVPAGVSGTVTTNMRHYSATATVNAGANVQIAVTALAATAEALKWNGAGLVWDVGASPNWDKPGPVADVFYNLDSASFDDTYVALAAADKLITVQGTVHPSALSIVSSDGNPWVLQGTGRITGVGTTLTKTGATTATINVPIDITGDIKAHGGALATGNSLGYTTLPGNVEFANSGSIGAAGGTLKLTGALSDVAGSGLRTNGAGTVILTTAANALTGPTVLAGGGVLEVPVLANGGAASSIGNASSAPADLTLGGILHYTGPSLTGASAWDRGFTANNGGGILVDNDITFTGTVAPGTAGTFSIIGGGSSKITFKSPAVTAHDFGPNVVIMQGGTIDFDSPAGTTYTAARFRFGEGDFINPHATVILRSGNHLIANTAGTSRIAIGYGVGHTDGTTGGATASLTMYGDSSIKAIIGSSRIFIGVTFNSYATGTVTMYDTSSIQGSQDLLVGNQGSVGTLTMNQSSSIYAATQGYIGNDGQGETCVGTVTLNDAATYGVGDTLDIGRNGGKGYVYLNGTSTMTSGTDARIGYIRHANTLRGNGTVTLNNSSQFTAGRDLLVGASNGIGSVTLNNSSKLTVVRDAYLGYFADTGTVSVNDSAQFSAATIQLCYNWSSVVTDNHATFNVNGSGALVSATDIIIGADGGQDATWNQNAGQTTAGSKVIVGEWDYSDTSGNTDGIGVLNLNGGRVTTPVVTTRSQYDATHIGPTYGTVNFNGGTLQAALASADFIATDHASANMTLVVKKNAGSGLGAVIDTQAFAVTITKPLEHDAAGPAIDGGLKKLGSGTLSLTAAPTYTGNTTVNDGTLTLSTPLSTPAANVYVATGATLNAPSITANSLTIGGPPLAAAAAVPEPGTFVLLVLAGLGAILAWRRK